MPTLLGHVSPWGLSALWAAARSKDIAIAREVGMDDYVIKPVGKGKLLQALANAAKLH